MANGIPNHSYESVPIRTPTVPRGTAGCHEPSKEPKQGKLRSFEHGSCRTFSLGRVHLQPPVQPDGRPSRAQRRLFSGSLWPIQESSEESSLDSCIGHSEHTCRYHYDNVNSAGSCHQFVPTNITVPGATCFLVGWMLDGFPLLTCLFADGQSVLKSCYT